MAAAACTARGVSACEEACGCCVGGRAVGASAAEASGQSEAVLVEERSVGFQEDTLAVV